MILIVLDSKETLVECVFDILEIIRDGCILGEPIHQRPVLPGPAPPCVAPTRFARDTYVRVSNSTGYIDLILAV